MSPHSAGPRLPHSLFVTLLVSSSASIHLSAQEIILAFYFPGLPLFSHSSVSPFVSLLFSVTFVSFLNVVVSLSIFLCLLYTFFLFIFYSYGRKIFLLT